MMPLDPTRKGTGWWKAERGTLATLTDGGALRHWRRMQGLTQAEAAGLWGFTREHWCRMEKDKVRIVRTLKRLADLTREGRGMTDQEGGAR